MPPFKSTILKHRILVGLSDQDVADLERVRGEIPISTFVRTLIREHAKRAEKVRAAYRAKKRREAQ